MHLAKRHLTWHSWGCMYISETHFLQVCSAAGKTLNFLDSLYRSQFVSADPQTWGFACFLTLISLSSDSRFLFLPSIRCDQIDPWPREAQHPGGAGGGDGEVRGGAGARRRRVPHHHQVLPHRPPLLPGYADRWVDDWTRSELFQLLLGGQLRIFQIIYFWGLWKIFGGQQETLTGGSAFEKWILASTKRNQRQRKTRLNT